jgi:xanthine phosphoribosyltransferase
MTPVQTFKVALELPALAQRLKGMAFPELDHVVGIASGGTVPATLIAYQLELPLSLLHINYRAEDNRPQRAGPELIKPMKALAPSSRVLLVDDVSVTGQTLATAIGLLRGHTVVTCVMKGRADYVAFPEIAACVAWPWKA